MRQSHVVLGAVAIAAVLEDVLAFDGRFGQRHVVADDRLEHLVAERILDQLGHTLVERLTSVELGDDDAANLQRRVQAFPDSGDHVRDLGHAAHGEELGLNGDNQIVSCGEGVECQQTQRGRAVDQDVIEFPAVGQPGDQPLEDQLAPRLVDKAAERSMQEGATVKPPSVSTSGKGYSPFIAP